MSDDDISVDKWDKYLDNLYEWIQEKYNLFEIDVIDENEYNEHLNYYMNEKERIENIIDNSAGNINSEDLQQNQPKTVNENPSNMNNSDQVASREKNKQSNSNILSQENFENFFGVKIEDELEKIQEEKLEKEKNDQQAITDGMQPQIQSDEALDSTQQSSSQEGFALDLADFDLDEAEKEDMFNINIILVGDSGTGRTSIRRSFMGKHFIESHLTTVGASIEKKEIEINGENYFITLTDLGGQDFYSGLRRNFYKNVDAALIVFDLTRPDTFRRLDYWIKEMYREIEELVPFIIVGNKCDSDDRKIPEKYGTRASAKYSSKTLPKFRVRYIETSAKTGKNIRHVFELLCREVRSLKMGN